MSVGRAGGRSVGPLQNLASRTPPTVFKQLKCNLVHGATLHTRHMMTLRR